MQDVFYLVILNLFFMFILVRFMESRVKNYYIRKYGAGIEEFECILVSMRNLDLKSIPKNKLGENYDSIYNKLLIISNSYVNSYMIIEKNKNQLEEFSYKNKELVKTYIKTLRALKRSAINFSELEVESIKEESSEIDNLVLKIEETISKLSEDNNK